MRRTAPLSLTNLLILLLLLAVLAAQVPACLIFALQSTKVGRIAFTLRIGDRVAALVHVLGVVPPNSIDGVVAAYNIPVSRFSVDPAARVALGSMDDDDAEIAHALARRLRFEPERVRIALIDNDTMIVRYLPWRATQKILLVSVRLADGRWLNGQSKVLLPDAPYWLQIGLVQLVAAIIAILLTLGLGLRHIIRPVMVLSEAAERAGHGTAVALLPERGPREFRTMTASFNAMQARLRAFVDDRTRMLGAISHDLRTPLSSLWLRAELVDDAELREAMVRTVAEMRDMVEATLAFSRDDAVGESGPLDLAQLARTIVDDQRALGRDVSVSGPACLPFRGRGTALRRALENLLENAVRYGERARLTLIRDHDKVCLQVDDDGPGLPPERIEDMFQPFVRLDDSRCAQTGGTGLGLAIARSAVREHGGELTLSNRPERGLRAEITMPLVGEPSGSGTPAAVQIAETHPDRMGADNRRTRPASASQSAASVLPRPEQSPDGRSSS